MPQLYGNQYKDEIRKERNEAQSSLYKERREHRQTKSALLYARCEVSALKAKIQRIEQKANDLLAEISTDIEDEVDKAWQQAEDAERRKRYAIT